MTIALYWQRRDITRLLVSLLQCPNTATYWSMCVIRKIIPKTELATRESGM